MYAALNRRLLALLSFVLLLLLCSWSAFAEDDGGAPGVDQHGTKPAIPAGLPPLPEGMCYTSNPHIIAVMPAFLNGAMLSKGMFTLPGYIFTAYRNIHEPYSLIRADRLPWDPKANIVFTNPVTGAQVCVGRVDGKPIPDGTFLGTCVGGPAVPKPEEAPQDEAPSAPAEPQHAGKVDDQSFHL